MSSTDLSFNAISELHFAPLLDASWLTIFAAVGALLVLASWFCSKRLMAMRLAVLIALFLCLLNPSLRQEERQYSSDVAVIVVDQSASQRFGNRTARQESALNALKNATSQQTALDTRIIQAPNEGGVTNETLLFSALDQTLSDVPQKRRAGVIFITDGQIHDIPGTPALHERYGPVHSLITGDKDDKDRRIEIIKAPAYGLVGKEIDITFKVRDTKNIRQNRAEVLLRLHDGQERLLSVVPNKEHNITVAIDNPAQNIFTLETPEVDGEITTANNKAPVLINGVRDRLKVLLVSGVPYSGERTWRNLLKSDPSVDLVHFTILREPNKFDYTPKHELALIPFPFRELFEVKLYDFDLIIFDRYRVNNILPDQYFENIVKYIRSGGAFLASAGPVFNSYQSITHTAIGDILPSKPIGNAQDIRYRPEITELGRQHPVINSLIWNGSDAKTETPDWGAWLRYVPMQAQSGDVLLSGPEDQPLLTLERIGDGRVAQLSSDSIWLWSRGYDGGGPHAELLRRIVHWLMKEPQLDERSLKVDVNDNTVTLSKNIYGDESETSIAMTRPDGSQEIISLKESDGIVSHSFKATQLGIYAFEDTSDQRVFAIVGELDPPELREVIASTQPLKDIVQNSRGTQIWLEDEPAPALRLMHQSASKFGGRDWIGLRQNGDYNVKSFKQTPLLPLWLSILSLLAIIVGLWWFEGRKA